MKNWFIILFLLFFGVIHHGMLFAQSERLAKPAIAFAPKHYICYHTDGLLTIDGKLSESNWQKAPWTDLFIDIEGDVKAKPRFSTRAKMLWDDQFFYVGAEMEEPEVWATLTERDAIIFYDNDFEVFIDPDGDSHQYYELEVNAFATPWDLLLIKPYRDEGPAVHSWDIQGLKTAVDVQGSLNQPGDRDQGWSVEIAIPWQVLKECAHKPAPPLAGDQWRINFSRVEWQVEVKEGKYTKVINPKTGKPFPEDNWVWSPQGLINMHYPELWGLVQFSEQVAGSGTENFVVLPEEQAKWALRQVYYRERNYFLQQKQFTDDLAKLGIKIAQVEGYAWPPAIQPTWNLFEARLKSQDGRHFWHINQEGRVWRTKK